MAIRPVDVTIRGKDDTKQASDAALRRMALLELEAHKMNDAMDASANKAKRSWLDLSKPLDLIKGLVAGALTAAVGSFFRASVESAAEADAAWGRAASALENAGLKANLARPEIDALAASIQASTRFSDDAATDSFATLLSISGDYAGSLKNVQLAADLAAAKNIDLKTASDLVGKAMVGQTSTLSRYGIVVKQGSDAVQEMRDRFNGFAERDAGTLQGQLAQVANAWDNVKEAVGRNISGMAEASTQSTRLVDSLGKLGTWLDEHHQDFVEFGQGLGVIGGALAGALNYLVVEPISKALRGYGEIFELAAKIKSRLEGTDVEDSGGDVNYLKALGRIRARQQREQREAEARNKEKAAAEQRKKDEEAAAAAHDKYITQLQKEVGELAKAKELGTLRVEDLKRLIALQAELGSLAQRGSLADRNAAAGALQQLDKASPLAGIPDISTTGAKKAKPGSMANIGAGDVAAPGAPPISEYSPSLGDDIAESFEKATASIEASSEAVRSLGHDIGDVAGGALVSFTDLWGQAAQQIGEGAISVGQAILKSTRMAIAGAVSAKGSETLLDAAKAAAEGFTNPVKFLQAAKLFAIGSGYKMLAGVLGGGGGGGGGSAGGGGGGGGLSPSGFNAGGGSIDAGHVTVVIKGKKTVIDHTDPDEQDAFVEMVKKVAGNRQVDFVYEGG